MPVTADVREILIVATPADQCQFRRLPGDGSQLARYLLGLLGGDSRPVGTPQRDPGIRYVLSGEEAADSSGGRRNG